MFLVKAPPDSQISQSAASLRSESPQIMYEVLNRRFR